MIIFRLFLGLSDGVAQLLLLVSMALMVVLLGSMMYEVGARYLFSASTLWASDVSYMTNGAMFMLVGAYAMMRNEHVRVDVLSARLSLHAQRAIALAFNLLMLIPVLGMLCKASFDTAWKLYLSGEKVLSAWEPLAWPFYATIALGFAALFLQTLAGVLRAALPSLAAGRSVAGHPGSIA